MKNMNAVIEFELPVEKLQTYTEMCKNLNTTPAKATEEAIDEFMLKYSQILEETNTNVDNESTRPQQESS